MKVSIVYDGQCPVCRHVVRAARLRERASEIELIDARDGEVSDIQGKDLRGLDFNQGFAVVVDGQVHHGADGAQMLAALTQPRGVGYRLFRWLVRNERRSAFWYPVLRRGRALLLWLLRVPKIGQE